MSRKISQFPAASTASDDDVLAGVKSGSNKKFSMLVIWGYISDKLGNTFVPTSRKINNKDLTTDITLDASDVGAYVKPSGGIPSSDMASAVQTSLGKADSAFQKPSGGIPSSDMDSEVQTSLGKADTAYQKPSGGIPATDLASGVIPTIPSAYTSNPEMDGTASPGSSGAWARGDHVHPSDTAKANQAQLATEETGSTASRAYDVGEYFCWNGLFYRVIQPISNGGTFTPGTNCVTETVGERLGLIKTVLCATGTSSNPVNTVIPLKNSHTYLVTIQRVGDQYSSFGLIVQSNGTVWKNDLASGGAYSNRYSVSTSTRTLTITAYLSAVIASIIDFGAYA